MRIRKSNLLKQKKIWIISGVVLLCGAYLGASALFNIWPFHGTDDIDYNPPTNEQKEAGEAISGQVKQGESEDSQEANKPQQDNEEANDDERSILEITATNQSDDTLHIRTLLQTLSPGKCTLTLQKAGQENVTQEAPTQALPANSTCQGFNVPLSQLQPGEWRVKITYKANENNTTGEATQNVTIE